LALSFSYFSLCFVTSSSFFWFRLSVPIRSLLKLLRFEIAFQSIVPFRFTFNIPVDNEPYGFNLLSGFDKVVVDFSGLPFPFLDWSRSSFL